VVLAELCCVDWRAHSIPFSAQGSCCASHDRGCLPALIRLGRYLCQAPQRFAEACSLFIGRKFPWAESLPCHCLSRAGLHWIVKCVAGYCISLQRSDLPIMRKPLTFRRFSQAIITSTRTLDPVHVAACTILCYQRVLIVKAIHTMGERVRTSSGA
jgi:hypothetical protein